MNNNNLYYLKDYKKFYLKYKKKYLNLKNKHAGALLSQQLKRRSSLIEIEKNNIQDCSIELNDNCFTIDGNIIFNSEVFKKPKQQQYRLGGAFGEVTLYESDEGNRMAIKEFNDPIEYYKEKLISIIISKKQKILKNALQIVPSYWYENGDERRIVMHGKNGNLNDKMNEVIKSGIENTFPSTFKNHFTETVKAIKLLWENDLYYCDLKLENVLYENKNSTVDKTYLADIGGVTYFNKEVNMDFFKSINGYNFYIDNSFYMYFHKEWTHWNRARFFGIVSSDWKENIKGTITDIGDYSQIIINDKLSGTIKLSSEIGIFTYPLQEENFVELKNNEDKLILLNNIFHSIIVFLFKFLSGQSYNFNFYDHDIKKSVDDINSWINSSNLNKKIKSKLKELTNYILVQSNNINKFLDLDGKIVEEINDKNIKEKFDKIISLVEKSY